MDRDKRISLIHNITLIFLEECQIVYDTIPACAYWPPQDIINTLTHILRSVRMYETPTDYNLKLDNTVVNKFIVETILEQTVYLNTIELNEKISVGINLALMQYIRDNNRLGQ